MPVLPSQPARRWLLAAALLPPTDPHQLALRNGAGTVVAGSYYLATDTLVIRATVEDAVSGTVLQTVPPVHVPADQAMRALDRLREQVVVALAGVFRADQ